MIDIRISKSHRPEKKFQVVIKSPKHKRTIHFGQAGAEDYTIHKDTARMQAYVKRHKPTENWKDPLTAGYWARWVLWGYKDLTKAKREAIKKAKVILERRRF